MAPDFNSGDCAAAFIPPWGAMPPRVALTYEQATNWHKMNPTLAV
jgi:hypothetical protein